MDNMISEVEETKYVIKVEGKTVSISFSSRRLAEEHIGNLPGNQQAIAEVVPVTGNGQEILFG